MSDLALEFGADLSLSANGDLAMVDGAELTRQRILRRLLTAVKAYIFHTEYGAGLPQRIGRPARSRNIQTLVRSQIWLESSVARIPIPVISVDESTAAPGLFVIAIKYADAVTGAAIAIQFEVPGQR